MTSVFRRSWARSLFIIVEWAVHRRVGRASTVEEGGGDAAGGNGEGNMPSAANLGWCCRGIFPPYHRGRRRRKTFPGLLSRSHPGGVPGTLVVTRLHRCLGVHDGIEGCTLLFVEEGGVVSVRPLESFRLMISASLSRASRPKSSRARGLEGSSGCGKTCWTALDPVARRLRSMASKARLKRSGCSSPPPRGRRGSVDASSRRNYVPSRREA